MPEQEVRDDLRIIFSPETSAVTVTGMDGGELCAAEWYGLPQRKQFAIAYALCREFDSLSRIGQDLKIVVGSEEGDEVWQTETDAGDFFRKYDGDPLFYVHEQESETSAYDESKTSKLKKTVNTSFASSLHANSDMFT